MAALKAAASSWTDEAITAGILLVLFVWRRRLMPIDDDGCRAKEDTAKWRLVNSTIRRSKQVFLLALIIVGRLRGQSSRV